MRALYWSCVAIVSVVVGDAVGCGGRLEVADCGAGRQYCSEANVCCPAFTVCGNGSNGCPIGDCCLSTSSHLVDGGGDGANGDDGGSDALSPTELPFPSEGPSGPSDPSPGSLPGNGGAGGGSQTPVGGDKQS